MISIEQVERSSNRTWPALDEFEYDGWLLRAANGVTRRANSVTVYAPSTAPIDEKVDLCEAWYTERRLPTIFRTTALTGGGVQAELDTRRYDDVPGAVILTLDLGGRPAATTTALPEPSDAWWHVFDQDRDVALDRSTVEAMVHTLDCPAAYVAHEHRGRPVAIGSATLDGGLVAVFNMRTDPFARRRGHGLAVLADLLAWGATNGAQHAYLQVAPANTGALALYQRAGFTPLYEYRYRSRR